MINTQWRAVALRPKRVCYDKIEMAIKVFSFSVSCKFVQKDVGRCFIIILITSFIHWNKWMYYPASDSEEWIIIKLNVTERRLYPTTKL